MHASERVIEMEGRISSLLKTLAVSLIAVSSSPLGEFNHPNWLPSSGSIWNSGIVEQKSCKALSLPRQTNYFEQKSQGRHGCKNTMSFVSLESRIYPEISAIRMHMRVHNSEYMASELASFFPPANHRPGSKLKFQIPGEKIIKRHELRLGQI